MTDAGSEIQKVIAVSEQEASAMRSGDMNEYLTILSDDAVFMPPNTLRKQGEELRQWLREFVISNRVEWPRFEHGETIVAGDLALHEYVYTMKVTPKSGASPPWDTARACMFFAGKRAARGKCCGISGTHVQRTPTPETESMLNPVDHAAAPALPPPLRFLSARPQPLFARKNGQAGPKANCARQDSREPALSLPRAAVATRS